MTRCPRLVFSCLSRVTFLFAKESTAFCFRVSVWIWTYPYSGKCSAVTRRRRGVLWYSQRLERQQSRTNCFLRHVDEGQQNTRPDWYTIYPKRYWYQVSLDLFSKPIGPDCWLWHGKSSTTLRPDYFCEYSRKFWI